MPTKGSAVKSIDQLSVGMTIEYRQSTTGTYVPGIVEAVKPATERRTARAYVRREDFEEDGKEFKGGATWMVLPTLRLLPTPEEPAAVLEDSAPATEEVADTAAEGAESPSF